VPLHRCGGVIHAHQKPSRHVLDAYALNVRQSQFTKAYPAKTLSAQKIIFLLSELGVLCVFARVILFRPK
jgi:hypothetical protein